MVNEMLKNENPVNPMSTKDSTEVFSCEAISTNPLLKIDNEYPRIFSALNNFNKNKSNKQNTNKIAIQLFEMRSRSVACMVWLIGLRQYKNTGFFTGFLDKL
jgi:hypothetical protein